VLKTVSTCFVTAVALAGCGSTGDTPQLRQRQATAQPTATVRAEAKTSDAPVSSSTISGLLTRSTQRPPDVSAQFNYVGGAGPGPCVTMPGGPPQVNLYGQPFPAEPPRPSDQVVSRSRITFDQSVDVCFHSFGRGPVDVTVSGPHAYSITGVLARLPQKDAFEGSEWTSYDWVPAIEPSWPLGRYTISALSGSRKASTSFTLIAPTEPGLRILGPSTDPGHNEVAPNSLARVFLVGFRNMSRVLVSIYRLPDMSGAAQYFSSAELSLPPSGNTTFNLATGAGGGASSTFIVTARDGSATLFAPLSVFKPYSDPSLIVGALPRQRTR
jgi:hypothetical protein